MAVEHSEWTGCYAEGWKGLCLDAAFQHPAKYSKSLIFRIVQHALDEGFVTKGATVFDPFAGVSLGSLPCNLLGLHWVGIELEEKFWQLSQGNIALWKTRYGGMPGHGTAICLRGDSRQFLSILQEAQMICSSPPYADGVIQERGGHLEAARLAKKGLQDQCYGLQRGTNPFDGYGSTPGNLGNLPVGDVGLVVSSPPFLGARAGTTASSETAGGGPCADRVHTIGSDGNRLGSTPGNLAAMPIGAVISSPPYADRCSNDNQRTLARDGLQPGHNEGDGATYGESAGNLSTLPSGEAPNLIVSSPPFLGQVDGGGIQRDGLMSAGQSGAALRPGDRTHTLQNTGSTEGNLAAMPVGVIITSPPFATSTHVNVNPDDMPAGKAVWKDGTDSAARVKQDYAPLSTPGNLANMVVTSPPFVDQEASHVQGNAPSDQRMKATALKGRVVAESTYVTTTPGQLAGMRVEAVVTSPPFMQSDNRGDRNALDRLQAKVVKDGHGHAGNLGPSIGQSYGEAEGQLGNESPSTFWEAAAQILSQCYALLPVGGHAIFVVKAYVSAGKIVDFPGQWAALCVSIGFTHLHTHHALLTTDHGTELGLFGGETRRQTKRVSFFRRLHEQKRPDLAIDHETILCFRKD